MQPLLYCPNPRSLVIKAMPFGSSPCDKQACYDWVSQFTKCLLTDYGTLRIFTPRGYFEAKPDDMVCQIANSPNTFFVVSNSDFMSNFESLS